MARDQETLAVVNASPGRRVLGLLSLGTLGFLTLSVAVSRPPAPGWQVFLLAMGAGALWAALATWRATASAVVLNEAGLQDADGTVIAPVEEIDGLDRGVFAFKPSNGFLLRTRSRAPAAWRPGLWWRLGRRVGVGGMTPRGQAKAMAEVLAMVLARRDQ